MSLIFFSPALWRSSRRIKISHDLGPFSTSQQIGLSSVPRQGIFEDLQASRARPSTSNCVLEDSTTDALASQLTDRGPNPGLRSAKFGPRPRPPRGGAGVYNDPGAHRL